jgi:glyoxylase-like metal-dependent hydrolase (beta-lactamase superfamily II)
MAISGRQRHSPINGSTNRDDPRLRHRENRVHARNFCDLFPGPQQAVAQVLRRLGTGIVPEGLIPFLRDGRTGVALGSKFPPHNWFKFLFLCSCVFVHASLAKSPQVFSIRVITSSDDQFWTNSIIIEGAHEVMLVDAQLTRTNAEKVLREIQATKKPLSIVYITHEHADHFLGLEVFRDAYPTARILANSNVLNRINKVYQEKIDKWKGILGSAAASHTAAISRYDDNFIRFENSKIGILKHVRGDTDENTMLWLPGQRTLIAGDVLFNDMHVYTAETDMMARKAWLNALKTIRDLKPAVVIPGHSKVGAPLDATSAVTFTEKYLSVFEQELNRAKDPDGLVKAMKEKFPSADLLLALERGAKTNVKQQHDSGGAE